MAASDGDATRHWLVIAGVFAAAVVLVLGVLATLGDLHPAFHGCTSLPDGCLPHPVTYVVIPALLLSAIALGAIFLVTSVREGRSRKCR